MSSGPLMVGVSGCRGIVGDSLTPEVAARFAGAFGSWLRQRNGGKATIVLGRDGRAGCTMVHHAALAGLVGAGVHVIDAGVSMTPTVAVMTDKHRAPGGMVLTASHNPQQWNGLKCLLAENFDQYGSAACAPAANFAAEIVARFQSANVGPVAWSDIGTIEEDTSASETHVERVTAAVELALDVNIEDLGQSAGVVLDSVNCSGVPGGLAMLERLGCEEILHVGGESTGIFPHAPEPTLENLTDLCAAVKEIEARVGFAQDPDADRLALIDEQGRYIGEEYTLVLACIAVLEAERRAGRSTKDAVLVANLSTSRMIDDVAAKYGARVVRTAVGEANVVEAMKRERAIIGGEGNGGVIWPRVTYVRDSLSGMALVLSLLDQGKKTLSQVVAGTPSYAIVKRKVDLAKKEHAQPAIEKLAKAYAKERVDRQDGVRIDFDSKRAWLHVRASNTEPIMRLIAEAPTREAAERVLGDAEAMIAS